MSKSELRNSEMISDSVGCQPYFIICKSCFWCASCVYDPHRIKKCPTCDDDTTIESIPLSNHEAYRFDYDNQRGVTMEFFPIDQLRI